FFTADDGNHSVELWKSDSTAGGAVLVKDIEPGNFSSFPNSLTAVGDTLFFRARDGVNGSELWRSDGEAAGTIVVADIHPGAWGSYPDELTFVNGALFFAADGGLNRTEPWVLKPLWARDENAGRPAGPLGTVRNLLTSARASVFDRRRLATESA